MAYGALGNGGIYKAPVTFTVIRDSARHDLYESSKNMVERQVFSPSTAWLVIDMMKVERAKANHNVGFRTGKHLTEKDRPRKKDWKREYERGKGSGKSYNRDWNGPFSLRLSKKTYLHNISR